MYRKREIQRGRKRQRVSERERERERVSKPLPNTTALSSCNF